MPTRFRRTFKIFPGVKVNVSKGGISYTIGTKGYHLNFSKRGVRQTVGLPGSGLSHTSYIVKNDSKSESETDAKEETVERNDSDSRPREKESAEREEEQLQSRKTQSRRSPAWVLLLGILVIYLGALVLGLIPINFLSQFLQTVTEWTRNLGL